MQWQPVVLWTDALLYLLLVVTIWFVIKAMHKPHIRSAWRKVLQRPMAVVALMVLCVYLAIGIVDSLHFRTVTTTTSSTTVEYSGQLTSVLDVILRPITHTSETTYSAPFALQLFSRETILLPNGEITRIYPRLNYVDPTIVNDHQRQRDIYQRIFIGFIQATAITFLFTLLLVIVLQRRWRFNYRKTLNCLWRGKTIMPLRTMILTLWCILLVIIITTQLASAYHIFGTNKVGVDVFYLTLKSIRTGLMIGTLTTLIMLPFALILGIAAGFFGGWVDDLIQYLYTTLSSIPGVLLIAAAILSIQVFISNHPMVFATLPERADARLLALCAILGITSWTGLCRLLRGETLKLREVDYTQAAIALGTSRWRILSKHMLPNVMHIVLITVVLDFSMLVLAEAVLSYVGVGVDPTSISWGNMINSARLELAREPMVWWPLLAAFTLMFILVLAANLFADAVRDGFDPRAQTT